jgi:hypothetical protein
MKTVVRPQIIETVSNNLVDHNNNNRHTPTSTIVLGSGPKIRRTREKESD